jgi:hypothetical protein
MSQNISLLTQEVQEVLITNIGRDISKFFYGGYSGKGTYAYAHS